MAFFSSHLLNSLDGTHAAKVKFKIEQIDHNGNRKTLLESYTDDSGRISKEFNLSSDDCSYDYEIIVNTKDFFLSFNKSISKNIVSEIIVRFRMEDDNKKYHIPIIIAPNSYSIWWSE